MIDCLHNRHVCVMCCEERADGLLCKMLWLNPETYPEQHNSQQVLRKPKEPHGGEWAVIIPAVDSDGESIEMMHTHVFLPYVRPNTREASSARC